MQSHPDHYLLCKICFVKRLKYKWSNKRILNDSWWRSSSNYVNHAILKNKLVHELRIDHDWPEMVMAPNDE